MQDKCSASNEMSSLQHMQSAEDGESELKSASSRLVQSSTKGGPVLLCTTQAEPVRIFSQPRARLIVVSCSCTLSETLIHPSSSQGFATNDEGWPYVL